MSKEEEARRWILEHPDEAKKIFNDFIDWYSDIVKPVGEFLHQFAQALLELYEIAIQQDKTGELRMGVEAAGFVVTEDGKIRTMPKEG